MKKALLILIAFISSALVYLSAYGEKYSYLPLVDGSVEIVGYSGSETDLTIPSKLDGLAVTSIGNGAFTNKSSLKSVTIPNSITSIGNVAFYGCKNLKSVTIADSVINIGTNPFAGCISLSSIYVSPDNTAFATIDNVLFNKKTKTLISFPAGPWVNSYEIPQGIKSIGEMAFLYCGGLRGITIPKTVESIPVNPFLGCINLSSIRIAPENENFISIDNVLIDVKTNKLITFPCGLNQPIYKIPENVLTIGGFAFGFCSKLRFITIPDSVTSIEDCAFLDCDGLTSITIPDSITSIGVEAFSECDSLTSITIPDSVTFIGDNAFAGSDALEILVQHGSYAAEYAKSSALKYGYSDEGDWLIDTTYEGNSAENSDIVLSTGEIDSGSILEEETTEALPEPAFSETDSDTTANGPSREKDSEAGIEIPGGIYTIGEDIPAGIYSITNTNGFSHFTVWESEYNDYRTDGGLLYSVNLDSHRNNTIGKIKLCSGNVVSFKSSAIFRKYTGIDFSLSESTTVPGGIYKIGEDIPAGVYSITNTSGFSRLTVWGAEYEDYLSGGGLLFSVNFDPNNNKTIGKIELKDGNVIFFRNSAVFGPPVSFDL